MPPTALPTRSTATPNEAASQGIEDASQVVASRAVRRASVVDADNYGSSIRGVAIHANRIGASREPNSVASVSNGSLTVTAAHIGFPISTTADPTDSALFVASIHSAPAGTRWVGIPLHADQMLLYAPGVEHSGVNLAGTSFTFATTEVERVQQQADQLGRSVERLDSGSVNDMTAAPAYSAITSRLGSIGALRAGTVPPWHLMDDLMSAIALALAAGDGRPAGARVRPPSGRIIRRCLEYLESSSHRPSIRELCLVSGVSERTLRDLFVSVFNMPPSVFLRCWALNRAYRRLSSGERVVGGVSDVAIDAGFGHLGRFARYYKQLFGELPSETYRSYAPTAPRIVRAPKRLRQEGPAGR